MKSGCRIIANPKKVSLIYWGGKGGKEEEGVVCLGVGRERGKEGKNILRKRHRSRSLNTLRREREPALEGIKPFVGKSCRIPEGGG